MNSQFNVTYAMPQTPATPADPAGQAIVITDLLRQLVEVQQQQLAQLRATAAAHDHSARWRTLLNRWSEEYPSLPEGCKHSLPILERAYGTIIAQLCAELRDNADALETEFGLQDFIDRYGMRLGQMGNLLNLVGPLVDAANSSQNEAQ